MEYRLAQRLHGNPADAQIDRRPKAELVDLPIGSERVKRPYAICAAASRKQNSASHAFEGTWSRCAADATASVPRGHSGAWKRLDPA